MRFVWIVFGFTLYFLPAFASAQTLFEEKFENASFSSRGWIDNTTLSLSTVEHLPGSVSSLQYRWTPGATSPINGGSARHLFTETDSLYISYWVKYSANWVGQDYEPGHHEFYVATNLEGDFAGLAATHLTAYIESNGNTRVGQLALQDALNINEANINVDLRGVTENRAVAGCNGTYPDGYYVFSCYGSPGARNNTKVWNTATAIFTDTPGQYYKNDWHHIEVFFNMNTIVGGIAQADGVMQYWFDGQLLINHSNVVYRTGQNPTMRWRNFIMAPYMGQGSLADQRMWIDDLRVLKARPTAALPAPTNLRVLP